MKSFQSKINQTMRKFQFTILTMLAFSMLLFSCGVNSEESNTIFDADKTSSYDKDQNEKDIDEAMDEAKNALKDLNGNDKETVNFRELKKLLPSEVAGVERSKSSGETSGIFGIKVSHAEAEYKDNDSGKKIDIDIIDVAGMGVAMNAMASWSSVQFDKEDEDGYERTLTYKGMKAFESYSHKHKSGEFAILVNERFIVTVKGRKVELSDLKDALKEIDLGDLKDLGQ